ncbi:phage tail protein [Streptomyces sp. NPDC052040]
MTSIGSLVLAKDFTVQIDGIQLTMIKEVSGLESRVEVTKEVVNTADGKQVHISVPGVVQLPSVTIVRQGSADKVIADWHRQCLPDKTDAEKKNVTIAEHTSDFSVKKEHVLTGCWVSSYNTGQLSAAGSGGKDETFVIECDGYEIK